MKYITRGNMNNHINIRSPIAASRHLQMAKIGTLGLNISSSIEWIESAKRAVDTREIGTLWRQLGDNVNFSTCTEA